MDIESYLAKVGPSLEIMMKALAPLQDQMRNDILAAESRYAKALSTPPKYEAKARRMPDERVSQMLLGYLYKWRDEDAEKALLIETEAAEARYDQAAAPHIAAHEARVKEATCSSAV